MTMSDGARSAKAMVQNLDAAEQKTVVRELNESIFPSNDTQRTLLWAILIVGLLTIAIVAMVIASRAENADAYIAITTLVVGGVIGLFSKSPASAD